MKSLTLTQRLTLVFALMLIICSALTVWIQYQNRTRFSDAMIQNLSRNLAGTIAKNDVLLNARGIENPAIKKLFDQMMAYNPSVEVYLLNAQGQIIADAAPAGHLRHQSVNLGPIKRLLAGQALPVYGDDPRGLEVQKVFSVTPLKDGQSTVGYLYVILQGEDYDQLQQGALSSAIARSMWGSVGIIVLCGLIAGGFAFYWVTHPVRRLTRDVNRLEEDTQSVIKRLAGMAYPQQHDEVAQLQRAFIDMARRIAEQWDSLELKDQQRREFVANISHDLRTPLMSIQGYLETLSVKANSLTDAERSRYLNIALTQSEKVGMLAQQLFELARLEHGVVKPQLERFSIPDLVQDVMQKFELAFTQRQLHLRVEIPQGLPLVNADMSMIERVITNLVDNATRHTPQGGTIILRVWHQHDQVLLELEDSGPGISSELSQTLFERPSVIDTTRRDNGGLGLVIVRRMLQLHRGDIRLMKAPGACFRFFVPV